MIIAIIGIIAAGFLVGYLTCHALHEMAEYERTLYMEDDNDR